jgi:hypothetical protein
MKVAVKHELGPWTVEGFATDEQESAILTGPGAALIVKRNADGEEDNIERWTIRARNVEELEDLRDAITNAVNVLEQAADAGAGTI